METLILFDIDGTLVRGGPAKASFQQAMERVFGTRGRAATWEFSGKTDPQIAREILEDAGVPPEEVDRGLDALWNAYLTEMETRIAEDPPAVLPGVRELLERLVEETEVALGLVTGNIAGGADLKLGAVGLRELFAVGGFGSDHPDRNELPGIAMGRARGRWGVDFVPEAVVVVGDTPRDVVCGRHAGTRTVAVATGRFSEEALATTEPDRLLPDLSETGRVLEAILDSRGGAGPG